MNQFAVDVTTVSADITKDDRPAAIGTFDDEMLGTQMDEIFVLPKFLGIENEIAFVGMTTDRVRRFGQDRTRIDSIDRLQIAPGSR